MVTGAPHFGDRSRREQPVLTLVVVSILLIPSISSWFKIAQADTTAPEPQATESQPGCPAAEESKGQWIDASISLKSNPDEADWLAGLKSCDADQLKALLGDRELVDLWAGSVTRFVGRRDMSLLALADRVDQLSEVCAGAESNPCQEFQDDVRSEVADRVDGPFRDHFRQETGSLSSILRGIASDLENEGEGRDGVIDEWTQWHEERDASNKLLLLFLVALSFVEIIGVVILISTVKGGAGGKEKEIEMIAKQVQDVLGEMKEFKEVLAAQGSSSGVPPDYLKELEISLVGKLGDTFEKQWGVARGEVAEMLDSAVKDGEGRVGSMVEKISAEVGAAKKLQLEKLDGLPDRLAAIITARPEKLIEKKVAVDSKPLESGSGQRQVSKPAGANSVRSDDHPPSEGRLDMPARLEVAATYLTRHSRFAAEINAGREGRGPWGRILALRSVASHFNVLSEGERAWSHAYDKLFPVWGTIAPLINPQVSPFPDTGDALDEPEQKGPDSEARERAWRDLEILRKFDVVAWLSEDLKAFAAYFLKEVYKSPQLRQRLKDVEKRLWEALSEANLAPIEIKLTETKFSESRFECRTRRYQPGVDDLAILEVIEPGFYNTHTGQPDPKAKVIINSHAEAPKV